MPSVRRKLNNLNASLHDHQQVSAFVTLRESYRPIETLSATDASSISESSLNSGTRLRVARSCSLAGGIPYSRIDRFGKRVARDRPYFSAYTQVCDLTPESRRGAVRGRPVHATDAPARAAR